jgi:hypothetical protein
MPTIAEQITELQAERAILVTAINDAIAGGQSFSQGSTFSRTSVNYKAMIDRRNEIDISIQRLNNGGRGFTIDMDAAANAGMTQGGSP